MVDSHAKGHSSVSRACARRISGNVIPNFGKRSLMRRVSVARRPMRPQITIRNNQMCRTEISSNSPHSKGVGPLASHDVHTQIPFDPKVRLVTHKLRILNNVIKRINQSVPTDLSQSLAFLRFSIFP